MAGTAGSTPTPTTNTRKSPSSLPPPRPKSPPEYPDLYGKRRELSRVQLLDREIGFLEDELKFVEGLHPASLPCKQVADFVVANSDPFMPTTARANKSCGFWKWLCGSACFNLSWICCCCCCCTPHTELPNCCDCTNNKCGSGSSCMSCCRAKTKSRCCSRQDQDEDSKCCKMPQPCSSSNCCVPPSSCCSNCLCKGCVPSSSCPTCVNPPSCCCARYSCYNCYICS